MKKRHDSPFLRFLLAGLFAVCMAAVARGQPGASQPTDPPYKRVLTGADKERVEELEKQITQLREESKYDEAIPLAEEVVAIRRHLQGPDHWNSIDAAWAVKNLCLRAAIPPEQQRKLKEADRAGQVAEERYAAGKYDDALVLTRQQLETYHRLLGDGHPDVALSLDNLAVLLYSKGDYAAAEPLYREALAMRRKLLADEHPDVALSLNNLAALLCAKGDYTAAEPLYRCALAMRRKLLGDEHPDVAASLNNLAALLCDKGDYAAAEPLYREALAMWRKLLGDEHRNVANSLNNLAALLDAKGDYAAAEPLYREALAMNRKLLGDEHPDVAATLNSLAALLCAKGDYTAAEPLYRCALAVRRKLLGDEHPDVAATLNNLASLLQSKGDYTAAEPLYREALVMSRKLLGDEHPLVALSLNNLAALLYYKGDYAAAEPLYREALAMQRKLLGDEHPGVATSLNNLANLLYGKGDYTAGEPLYSEALASKERLRTGIIGGEAERGIFAEKLGLRGLASLLCSVQLRLGKAADGFDGLERGRSRTFLDLLAREERDLVAEALGRGDERAAAELQRRLADEERRRVDLGTAEAALAATQKRQDLDKDEKQKLIDEQMAAVRQARRTLADASSQVLAALREVWPDAQPLSVGQICSALKTGEVILTYNWTNDCLSALTVVSSAAGSVQGSVLVDGNEKMKKLQELVADAREQLSNLPAGDAQGATDAVLNQLRAVLIDDLPAPMRAQVQSARRLIVLPDGPLHDIPFDVIFAAGQSVSGTKPSPEIVYADSATLYINRCREAESKKKPDKLAAIIVGDPIFDRERVEPKYPDSGVLIAQVVEGSNAAGAGLTRGDVILRYDGKTAKDYQDLVNTLQAVGKELEAGDRKADKKIAVSFWRDGKKRKTKVAPGKLGVALDKGAPKEGLKLLAMRSRGEEAAVAEVSMLDQIRLHGGALSPLPGTLQEAKAIARTIKQAGGGADSLLGEAANLHELESRVEGKRILHIATHGLTGSSARPYDASLALTLPEKPSPDDIGFLTFDHLIRKWRGKLKDCDLVVLSACDTQRGIKKGDSVMALPWGFFYAGARTVIASLWKVDDVSTSILMEEFYRNLLERKMSKAQALQTAKETLRTMGYEEARRRAQMSEADFERYAKARGIGMDEGEAPKGERRATTPYAHPYYWAAFVLIGSPE